MSAPTEQLRDTHLTLTYLALPEQQRAMLAAATLRGNGGGGPILLPENTVFTSEQESTHSGLPCLSANIRGSEASSFIGYKPFRYHANSLPGYPNADDFDGLLWFKQSKYEKAIEEWKAKAEEHKREIARNAKKEALDLIYDGITRTYLWGPSSYVPDFLNNCTKSTVYRYVEGWDYINAGRFPELVPSEEEAGAHRKEHYAEASGCFIAVLPLSTISEGEAARLKEEAGATIFKLGDNYLEWLKEARTVYKAPAI